MRTRRRKRIGRREGTSRKGKRLTKREDELKIKKEERIRTCGGGESRQDRASTTGCL